MLWELIGIALSCIGEFDFKMVNNNQNSILSLHLHFSSLPQFFMRKGDALYQIKT